MANSSPASHEDHPTPLRSAPATPDSSGHPSGGAAGSVAAEISNRIVSLLREHAGRGPTKAKTTVSSDLVVTTLADCFTIAERRLLATGHAELVATTRAAIHDGMRAEATAIVEELTDRHVSAYLTDQGHDPDLAVLVFFLAPPHRDAA